LQVINEATDKLSSPSLDCVVGCVGNGSRTGLLGQQSDEEAAIVESQRKRDSDPANQIDRLRNQHLCCMVHNFAELLESSRHRCYMVIVTEGAEGWYCLISPNEITLQTFLPARGANSLLSPAGLVETVGRRNVVAVDMLDCYSEGLAGKSAWSRSLLGLAGNAQR
jgi:hypothetical protein